MAFVVFEVNYRVYRDKGNASGQKKIIHIDDKVYNKNRHHSESLRKIFHSHIAIDHPKAYKIDAINFRKLSADEPNDQPNMFDGAVSVVGWLFSKKKSKNQATQNFDEGSSNQSQEALENEFMRKHKELELKQKQEEYEKNIRKDERKNLEQYRTNGGNKFIYVVRMIWSYAYKPWMKLALVFLTYYFLNNAYKTSSTYLSSFGEERAVKKEMVRLQTLETEIKTLISNGNKEEATKKIRDFELTETYYNRYLSSELVKFQYGIGQRKMNLESDINSIKTK